MYEFVFKNSGKVGIFLAWDLKVSNIKATKFHFPKI